VDTSYRANEPTLPKLVCTIMDLLADVLILLPPRVDYYRAFVGLTSSTITS
jgi:hypothetical protein